MNGEPKNNNRNRFVAFAASALATLALSSCAESAEAPSSPGAASSSANANTGTDGGVSSANTITPPYSFSKIDTSKDTLGEASGISLKKAKGFLKDFGGEDTIYAKAFTYTQTRDFYFGERPREQREGVGTNVEQREAEQEAIYNSTDGFNKAYLKILNGTPEEVQKITDALRLSYKEVKTGYDDLLEMLPQLNADYKELIAKHPKIMADFNDNDPRGFGGNTISDISPLMNNEIQKKNASLYVFASIIDLVNSGRVTLNSKDDCDIDLEKLYGDTNRFEYLAPEYGFVQLNGDPSKQPGYEAIQVLNPRYAGLGNVGVPLGIEAYELGCELPIDDGSTAPTIAEGAKAITGAIDDLMYSFPFNEYDNATKEILGRIIRALQTGKPSVKPAEPYSSFPPLEEVYFDGISGLNGFAAAPGQLLYGPNYSTENVEALAAKFAS